MKSKTLSLFVVSGLVLFAGCGGSKSTNESSKTSEVIATESTQAENEATWVINAPGDAFSAAAAQTVCDLMRAWAPPVGTSAEQVADLEKYAGSLRRLVGSPSGASHAKILGHAEALLANEEKYPGDDVMPASFGWIEGACDDLGLTPENSKFGLKDSDVSGASNASTTAAPNPYLSASSILSVICDQLPEQIDEFNWVCGFNGLEGNNDNQLNLFVAETEEGFLKQKQYEIENFSEVNPGLKDWLEATTLCGEGWILRASGALLKTSLAEKTYKLLREAKIPATRCS
jgi:hypothetical protein